MLFLVSLLLTRVNSKSHFFNVSITGFKHLLHCRVKIAFITWNSPRYFRIRVTIIEDNPNGKYLRKTHSDASNCNI